jgi:hypothetical protein
LLSLSQSRDIFSNTRGVGGDQYTVVLVGQSGSAAAGMCAADLGPRNLVRFSLFAWLEFFPPSRVSLR